MDQPLSPSAWLAQWPLQPHEQLFAVLGNASDAQPFEAWQGVAAGAPPRSIWASTWLKRFSLTRKSASCCKSSPASHAC